MNWHTYRAFYMWLRNYNVFIRLFWSIAPGFVIEPVVLLVALGFGFGSFIGDINGQPYMEFIIPGVIASYAMTSATFECTYNVFFRMDYRKTYDSILATPMNVSDVVTGRTEHKVHPVSKKNSDHPPSPVLWNSSSFLFLFWRVCCSF
ncbi:ABC transporter permease [Dehalococcoides mccartyi]|uniref:ABC transporter permease n=1 Tax=Dehalococcoides mccartyi TaxID=61435 RepID=A0A2J1DSI5_9CHLR|nr:ABC transporter permease [Dehalococcoides mccartyi]